MVKRLLYLMGLATFIVVLNHSVANGYNAMFWWTDRYLAVSVPNFDQIGGPTYYSLRLVEQAIIFGIPSFLFVSGFFIAFATPRSRSTIGWDVVLARVKALGIPFLIWSVVYLVVNILQGERDTIFRMIGALLTGRTTDAFYYIPVLIQLFLLSPFMIPLAKTRWKLLLVLTALLQLCVLIIRYDQILGVKSPVLNSLTFLARNWLFPGYIFWFALGIVVGLYLPQLKIILVRIKWVLLASLIFTFILGFVEWEVLFRLSGESWISPRETLIDNLYAFSFILCFLAFEKVKYPFHQSFPNLGTKSYGVYLVHSLVLLFVAKALYHLLPKILAYPILFILVLLVMGLGIPLFLMTVVNRSPVRRYYETLFG